MRTWMTVWVDAHDRPRVERQEPDELDDEPSMTVWLSPEMNLQGTQKEIVRFVQELAAQVALQEA